MLQFKDCSIYHNLTKKEIIEKLADLKREAEKHEERARKKDENTEQMKAMI